MDTTEQAKTVETSEQPKEVIQNVQEVQLNQADKELQEEIKLAITKLGSTQERFQAVALAHYYEEKKKLDSELEKKIKELTLEFDSKAQPLLKRQAEIIQGKTIQESEITCAKDYLTVEDLQSRSKVLETQLPIAEYWLTSMLNSEILQEEIKEKDEDALKHLTNLEYQHEKGSNNFTLIFHFGSNEFFTNEVLQKKFFVNDDDEVIKTEGTEVNWKEGKDLTVKIIKKTQKNKKTNAKRVVEKKVQDESFFNFFKDDEGEQEKDKEEDEEENPQGLKIQIDQDIGRTLVEEVIPYSIEYFLGVRQGEQDDYEGVDEEGEFEDDEEEEEEQKPKGKKDKKQHKKSNDSTGSNNDKKGGDKGDKGEKGGAQGGQKPECKQQ